MGDPEAMLVRGNCYGFTFKLAAQDEQDRERCQKRIASRESKWDPYANRKTLPSGKKLKRYLRKVCGAFRGHISLATTPP